MKPATTTASLLLTLVFVGGAAAETRITLTDVHICCGTCVKDINKTLSKVKGVTAKVDQAKKSVSIMAKDDVAGMRALNALMKAGFHGKSDNKKLAMKALLPKGKTNRFVFQGAHNCCGTCVKAITKAAKSVDGVAAVAVEPRGDTFVVEGDDFEVAAIVRAMNASGFFVRPAKKSKP